MVFACGYKDSAWILRDITKIAKSDLIGLFLEFSAEGCQLQRLDI